MRPPFVLQPILISALLFSVMAAAPAVAGDKTIDYGAAKVNSLAPTPGTKMGGADTFNYLALTNHCGPSGVPRGGHGVGRFY